MTEGLNDMDVERRIFILSRVLDLYYKTSHKPYTNNTYHLSLIGKSYVAKSFMGYS